MEDPAVTSGLQIENQRDPIGDINGNTVANTIHCVVLESAQEVTLTLQYNLFIINDF
jgi:hypothetical protein